MWQVRWKLPKSDFSQKSCQTMRGSCICELMAASNMHCTWSWHVYCFNRCARMCHSHHIITRCRFPNRARRQSRFPTFISCQRQDANVLPKRRQSHQGDNLCDISMVTLMARWPVFLACRSDADGEPHWPIRCKWGAKPSIFLAPIWLAFASHVVLFWSWLPWCRRWTAPVHREIQRKICEMLGISALEGYQVEALEGVCLNKCDTLACANWEQKSPTFRRNPHHDRPCHWERQSRLVWCLWLARCILVWNAPPPVMLRSDQIITNAVVAIRPWYSECTSNTMTTTLIQLSNNEAKEVCTAFKQDFNADLVGSKCATTKCLASYRKDGHNWLAGDKEESPSINSTYAKLEAAGTKWRQPDTSSETDHENEQSS